MSLTFKAPKRNLHWMMHNKDYYYVIILHKNSIKSSLTGNNRLARIICTIEHVIEDESLVHLEDYYNGICANGE